MKLYAMKAYEGKDVQIHIFYTSALVGAEWSPKIQYTFYLPGHCSLQDYTILTILGDLCMFLFK
jgi:hypothetical protein